LFVARLAEQPFLEGDAAPRLVARLPGTGTVRRRQISSPVVASWAVMAQASEPPRGMQLLPETILPPAMICPDEWRGALRVVEDRHLPGESAGLGDTEWSDGGEVRH